MCHIRSTADPKHSNPEPGKFFEGTAEQMDNNLSRIATLPPAVKVFCGHEYTVPILPISLLFSLGYALGRFDQPSREVWGTEKDVLKENINVTAHLCHCPSSHQSRRYPPAVVVKVVFADGHPPPGCRGLPRTRVHGQTPSYSEVDQREDGTWPCPCPDLKFERREGR